MKAVREVGFGPDHSSDRKRPVMERAPTAMNARKAEGRQPVRPRRGEREARTLLRRRQIWQLRRIARNTALVLLILGVIVAQRSGAADAALTDMRAQFAAVMVDLGFVVKRVEISGLTHMSEADLRSALGIHPGDPIFAFDMDEARGRLAELGSVKSVSVARQLPDGVVIHVEEREPYALWQFNGQLRVIGRDGVVITDQEADRFAGLPVVVGEGADRAVAPLIDMMSGDPALRNRVRAAVRVGDRRWDIVFDNGMRARLPGDGELRAWHRLTRLVKDRDLLSRAVHVVDLRLDDRVVLRLTREAAEAERARKSLTGKGGAV